MINISMEEGCFLIWSTLMFILGYVFGMLQQHSNVWYGHDSMGGIGTCLHINRCDNYILRSQCSKWLDF